ncbi:MAG: ABC transporter permease [Candidatus Firestonebacteria bacterium]|nr:ABC transporter permease [Candidatus Firestonebacteria bacterium]
MNSKIYAIMKKEMLHIIRDPRSLFMAIGMPVIFIILFGYAINMDIDNVKIIVCDHDKTAKSREYVSGFVASGYFKIIKYTDRENDLVLSLDKGETKAGILIPVGFSDKLSRNKQAKIQVLVDGADTNSTNIAVGYVRGLSFLYTAKLTVEALNKNGMAKIRQTPGIESNIKIFYNREMKSRNFIIPGLIAVIMSVIMGILTSLTIVREKEKGTFEQLIVTPIKPYEVMIGKIIPYWVLGMFDMLLVVLVGTLVFGVPLTGNLFLLFFMTGIFAFSGLGVGLVVSTLANTQQVANQVAMLISFLPVFILSGFMFPIKSMPVLIQAVTVIVPAKYFLLVLRGVFLKGSGLFALLFEFFVLSVFGFLFMLLAAKKFKKKLK